MADDPTGLRWKSLFRRSLSYCQGGAHPLRLGSGGPLPSWPGIGASAARLWLREARTHPVLMAGLLALWGLALAVIILRTVG